MNLWPIPHLFINSRPLSGWDMWMYGGSLMWHGTMFTQMYISRPYGLSRPQWVKCCWEYNLQNAADYVEILMFCFILCYCLLSVVVVVHCYSCTHLQRLSLTFWPVTNHRAPQTSAPHRFLWSVMGLVGGGWRGGGQMTKVIFLSLGWIYNRPLLLHVFILMIFSVISLWYCYC